MTNTRKWNFKLALTVFTVAALSIWIASCAHSGNGRNPGAAPLIDEKAILDALDFELAPGETWAGGSRQSEAAGFLSDANEIQIAQQKLKEKNGGKPARVFHAKQQGCLVGSLQVYDANPKIRERSFRGGLFAKSGSYPFLARFSNGVGVVQSDINPDVRGVAFKIFNVKDEASGEAKTMDLNFTNASAPFGKDQAQFIEFMKANIAGNTDFEKGMPAFTAKYPSLGFRIINVTTRAVFSLFTETYWSGHPYLMRSGGRDHAVKFVIRPLTDAGYRVESNGNIQDVMQAKLEARYGDEAEKHHFSEEGPAGLFDHIGKPKVPRLRNFGQNFRENILRENVQENAKSNRLGFALMIVEPQFNSATGTYDNAKTPVENNLVPWEDTLHSEIVARFVFDRQNQDDELDALCDSAAFTPGHFVSQHRPLSNMGRGRIFSYRMSALGRGAAEKEVSVEQVEKLRERVRIRK